MTSNFIRRSRKMECPECRQKYTARTLTKLFLNPVFKDEGFDDDSQYLKLQEEKKKLSELQNDNKKILTENKEMELELLKSRDEFQCLS